MSRQRTLILDADGVFMSERPYWNAALATALEAGDLAPLAAGRWDALADYAFGPLGLQRVTKGRGCNSNWDLAAVLVRALEDPDARGVVREMLAAGRDYDAMQALGHAGNAVWERARAADSRSVAAADPLERFGIDRKGEAFADVVRRYQRVLHRESGIDWPFERWQLKEARDRTCRALEAFERHSWTLRVCTGRHRREIEEPITYLEIEAFFPSESITSADDVDRAETLTGLGPLGKPHWFAPACAALGFETALSALSNGTTMPRIVGAAYVGDAWADYEATEACRAKGLDLAYVHTRSGVTSPEQERTIAASPATLAVVDRLEQVVPVLTGAAR